MKNISQQWEDWKKSPIGIEAMLSVDREASMFQAFLFGIHLAEKEFYEFLRRGHE